MIIHNPARVESGWEPPDTIHIAALGEFEAVREDARRRVKGFVGRECFEGHVFPELPPDLHHLFIVPFANWHNLW